jgi:hypothetical protein
MQLTASFDSMPTAGMFDQNSSHRLSSRREKVSSVLPRLRLAAEKSQIGFVNKSRGLQRMFGRFILHPSRRQSPKLLIHQRQQLLRRANFAVRYAFEDA